MAREEHCLSYRYTAGYDLFSQSGNDYGILDHFHLEAGALPSVLWELIPFSWLFDYFTTIGPFLDDVFVSPSAKCLYVVRNRRYEVGTGVSLKPDYTSQGYSYKPVAVDDGFFAYKQVYFTRDPFGSLPTRSLRFRSLDEIGNNALSKAFNLLALLRPEVKLSTFKK
jgi:hypothetical protein